MVLHLRRTGLGSKFGVYIPKELANDLERFMKALGISSKSALVREALKLFIIEHEWKVAKEAVGIVGVIYNHEVRGVDEELTNIQHDFLDIIVSTLHVHLSKEKCMLAIAVRGDAEKIKHLIGRLSIVKGVEITRPLLLAVEE